MNGPPQNNESAIPASRTVTTVSDLLEPQTDSNIWPINLICSRRKSPVKRSYTSELTKLIITIANSWNAKVDESPVCVFPKKVKKRVHEEAR